MKNKMIDRKIHKIELKKQVYEEQINMLKIKIEQLNIDIEKINIVLNKCVEDENNFKNIIEMWISNKVNERIDMCEVIDGKLVLFRGKPDILLRELRNFIIKNKHIIAYEDMWLFPINANYIIKNIRELDMENINILDDPFNVRNKIVLCAI